MNRRNFLKALASTFGAAAIPTALVEACQIDAPVPADWVVKLLDQGGAPVAEAALSSLTNTITFPITKTCVVESFYISGGGLPHEIVGQLRRSGPFYMMAGDTMNLCDVHITLD